MTERGQTAQDFLIGVSVLLLTLFGVFGLVPQFYEPFADPVDASEETMADSLAERLVSEHRVTGTTNTLNHSQLQANVTSTTALRRQARAAGVLDRKVVNVTLLDGPTREWTGGPTYHQNTSIGATAVRVVRFDNASRCSPTCRLVVRVWA
ncbi:hypothetical protein ACKVMT_01570 [Halobacteriales archaeon Cl-PHB]